MTNYVLKGPKWQGPLIDIGIGEYFFEKAGEIGDRIFQIDGMTGEQQTYQEVKQRSVRVALYLQKIGLKPKDIVVVCCKNNLNNIVPALAALYLGAWISSVEPRQTADDIACSLKMVEPKVIVVEATSLKLIENALRSIESKPEIIVIGSASDLYPNMLEIETRGKGEYDFRPLKQKGSDVALVFFSSGTTSTPKAICRSNFSMLNMLSIVKQHNHLGHGTYFHFASLYWISAWGITLIALVLGSSKVVGESISAFDCLRIIDKYKVNVTYITSMYAYLLTNMDLAVLKKFDTSSLSRLLLAGSPVDSQQIFRLRNYFPHSYINLMYACTEVGYIAGFDYTKPEIATEKVSSSGTVLPGMELKVVDVDTGTPLGPNQEGELCVKSPLIMSGYYKFTKPDASDEDGFFKLGDLGYYDEDGCVYVIDRVGETFKYGVEKISPSVIEAVLMRHPAIKEAVAFGIPEPRVRNLPAACVTLKLGASISPEKIVDYVNGEVPDSYKLRGGVNIVSEIPKTPTGKLKRREIKEKYIKSKGLSQENKDSRQMD